MGLSSWLLLSLVPCKRGAHHRSTWVSRSNGIKNSAKVFSFVDSSDSSRVKWDRGHHNREVAPEGATRAVTDRPVRDRKHPLYRCSGRTYLGNRLSPSSWPIDSQNRGRDRTELESNPPTSQRARRQGDYGALLIAPEFEYA